MPGLKHQAVVVVEFLTRRNVAQCPDEHPLPAHLGFAIGCARMVDPACGVAAIERVDYAVGVDVEIERVLGLLGVMRVALERFVPGDDLSTVLQNALPRSNRAECEYAFAVNAGRPYFNPSG